MCSAATPVFGKFQHFCMLSLESGWTSLLNLFLTVIAGLELPQALSWQWEKLIECLVLNTSAGGSTCILLLSPQGDRPNTKVMHLQLLIYYLEQISHFQSKNSVLIHETFSSSMSSDRLTEFGHHLIPLYLN